MGNYVRNVQVVRSCSMGTNLGAPPPAAPKFFAHSAEEQEAWLPPAAAGTEVADSPTAAVVAWT